MFRTVTRFAIVATACAVAGSISPVAQAAPLTELTPKHGPVTPLKNAAMVTKSKHGWIYHAGQQDSRLTVTYKRGRVHFTDTGTRELRKFHKRCRKEGASKGISVSCPIASRFSASNPTFVQIWPRLGDDFVDASSMPAKFRMWVLLDKGNDVAYTGAGNDFINGAQNSDRVHGGAGNDWLRTGKANDTIYGGPGNDRLVGVAGHDTIYGGAGNDRVGGGPGNDRLYGQGGRDHAVCGGGADNVWLDRLDRATRDCERVSRS